MKSRSAIDGKTQCTPRDKVDTIANVIPGSVKWQIYLGRNESSHFFKEATCADYGRFGSIGNNIASNLGIYKGDEWKQPMAIRYVVLYLTLRFAIVMPKNIE